MKHSDAPALRKVVAVGDNGVGKCSLLLYMATGKFNDGHVRQIMYETRSMDLEINGRLLELELWHTAPHEAFDRLRPLAYPNAAVIVLVFAIDNPASFRNISERWHPEIAHFCSNPTIPTILIGCKSDVREWWSLVFDGSAQPKLVTKAQGHSLAAQIGAVAYLECSPRSKEGMQEVTELIGKTAISWDPLAERRRKRTCQIV